MNYARKRAAHQIFNQAHRHPDLDDCGRLQALGVRCAEPEMTDLRKQYGVYQSNERYPKIAQRRLEVEKRLLLLAEDPMHKDEESDDSSRSAAASKKMDETGLEIVGKLEKYVPNEERLSHFLDEEQERELEQELEEQRQVSRPGPAQPRIPSLSAEVCNFVLSGRGPNMTSWALPLPSAFRNTSLSDLVQLDAWSGSIFVTEDFANVVVREMDRTYDEFLRPVNWIAAVGAGTGKTLLVLSSFEANELMPFFRSPLHLRPRGATLRMFAPRISPGQDVLFHSAELAVPSSHYPPPLLAPDAAANLFVFSGCTYFCGREEQDAFCEFVGYIPRPPAGPGTEEEEKAFENGWTVNGFVKPDHRQILATACRFRDNPDKLVGGIIQRRLELFSPLSHVSSVLVEGRKVFD